jgi:hypothetical protein
MAQIEREKQEKKAARRAAKVRDPGFPTLPGFFSRFRVSIGAFFPATAPFRYFFFSPRPPPLAVPQEAKAEARKEREDFLLNGPNKKLTKKERRKLEAAEDQ